MFKHLPAYAFCRHPTHPCLSEMRKRGKRTGCAGNLFFWNSPASAAARNEDIPSLTVSMRSGTIRPHLHYSLTPAFDMNTLWPRRSGVDIQRKGRETPWMREGGREACQNEETEREGAVCYVQWICPPSLLMVQHSQDDPSAADGCLQSRSQPR